MDEWCQKCICFYVLLFPDTNLNNGKYKFNTLFNTLLTFYLYIIIKLKLVLKKILVTHIHLIKKMSIYTNLPLSIKCFETNNLIYIIIFKILAFIIFWKKFICNYFKPLDSIFLSYKCKIVKNIFVWSFFNV